MIVEEVDERGRKEEGRSLKWKTFIGDSNRNRLVSSISTIF